MLNIYLVIGFIHLQQNYSVFLFFFLENESRQCLKLTPSIAVWQHLMLLNVRTRKCLKIDRTFFYQEVKFEIFVLSFCCT